jgi:hypothetical protein
MKRIFSLFLIISALIAFSCSDDATGPSGGGLGGGGNGGGGVTFTMGAVQGSAQGQTIFTFKPSVDVTVTTVTLSLPAQSFTDTQTNPDPNTVLTAQNVYGLDQQEYIGVQSGQQWTFTFVGKLGSSSGTAYNVTANYTIP